MNLINIGKNTSWFTLGISVAVVLLFGAIMVESATTISTNVNTGGTLTVTGASTLTGAVWATSTLQVTGAVKFYSTLALEDDITLENDETISNDTDGTIALGGDVSISGGDGGLVVTSTNAATSSVTVGCIETYATSTATTIKQMFFASSTLNIDGASITAGFGGGTHQGIVLWGFGTCP